MKYDICVYATYEKASLKQLLKKTFKTTKKRVNYWIKSVSFINKVIDIIQLLVKSDRETYCCYLKSSCSYDWDNCSIWVTLAKI